MKKENKKSVGVDSTKVPTGKTSGHQLTSKLSSKIKVIRPRIGNKTLQQESINIPKLLDAGISTVDTIISTVENPVDGIINKLPNTIAKFVDAMGETPMTKKDVQPMISGEIINGSKEEKFIQSLQQSMPTVNITQLPSAFAPDYTPQPLKIEDMRSKVGNGIRVSGSAILYSVSAPDGGGALRPISRVILNPYAIGGQMTQLTKMYQRNIWLKAGLFYIPSCPSTTTGNIILTFQNTTNFSYTATTDINQLSQRAFFKMGAVTKGLDLPLPVKFANKYNIISGAETSDSKWFADWTREAWILNLSSSAGLVGFVGLTFDIFFVNRVEPDLPSVLDKMHNRAVKLFFNFLNVDDIKGNKILSRLVNKDLSLVFQKDGLLTKDHMAVRNFVYDAYDKNSTISIDELEKISSCLAQLLTIYSEEIKYLEVYSDTESLYSDWLHLMYSRWVEDKEDTFEY